MRLVRAAPVAVVDDDKVLLTQIATRLVLDDIGGNGQTTILDAIGAVEDYLDSIRDTGIMEGSDGFDDREWTLNYSKTTAGSRIVSAEAQATMIVKIKRGNNRVPA